MSTIQPAFKKKEKINYLQYYLITQYLKILIEYLFLIMTQSTLIHFSLDGNEII